MKKAKTKSPKTIKKEMMYQTITGEFSEKHNCVFTDDGKSIVISENKPRDPSAIYCPPASDKDRVEVVITSYEKDKPYGYISKVLSRYTMYDVGICEAKNGNIYLNPFGTQYGSWILLPPSHLNGAIDGSMVTFIVNGKDEYGKYDIYVKDVIGHKNEPNAFVKGVAIKYGLSTEFNKACQKQVEATPDKVSGKEIVGRADKRNLLTITIDGKDTKDRDDAVRLEILPDGNYLLGVDIADVDYYVPFGTAVDLEAKKRGTSCYAGGTVIPMLDKRLSNGICSLNEGVDRLTLSCDMKIDRKGYIYDVKLSQSVINVDYNMTYDQVMDIVDGNAETIEEFQEVVPMITDMLTLASILEKRAKKKGYLEFSSKEAKLKISVDGKLEGIYSREANVATKLIQYFMISANIAVATALTDACFPCVYRVHDYPDDEKLEVLCNVITELGYNGEMDSFSNPWKFFQNVINDITGKGDEDYIMMLLKRTQRKAKYSINNIGHFGIAETTYCHFTSPIRRYPDLCVHRAVKALLTDDNDTKTQLDATFEKDALSSSRAEVKADDVEREVEKIYKCLYIKEHVGEVFTGKISGMAKNGLFVELPNTIEGFTYLGSPAKLNYDEKKMTLIDKSRGHMFRLGEEVQVKVSSANEIAQTIDFELV